MPVFHITTSEATAKRRHASLQALLASLNELCDSTLAGDDFERFERELHALFVAAECELLAETLAELDLDVPVVMVDGQRCRRVLRSSETYTSAVGPVRVERTLYRAGQGKSVAPMELRAGIVEGHWTPLAARQASFLVAQLPPQACEDTLRELGNMSPSKSSLDRLPKRLSERWEAAREANEAVLREGLTVPEETVTVGVSLDGVLVPMKDGGRQAKRARARATGQPTKGPAGYREAGCATMSLFDRDGERLDTIRFARMPEKHKATLKSMLARELEAVLAQRPELTVVKLADGAVDNWTYLSKLVPHGEQRIDFFHAVEQLKAAFDAAYGEADSKGRVQFAKNRHVLRHELDGVERVIRALGYLRKKHPRRKRIGEVLGYFRRHRHRMDYAAAALCGLPIGSGVVEAACKTVVTQRMKGSGMRWRHHGGQAILTLRGWLQSHRFEPAWRLLSETYRGDVETPDVDSATPRKRAA